MSGEWVLNKVGSLGLAAAAAAAGVPVYVLAARNKMLPPDLAAALQAQGLTLSGGGVFAQTSSQGGQNRGDGSPDGASNGNGRRGGRGDDDGAVAATGRGERRTAPRGLVDLYA